MRCNLMSAGYNVERLIADGDLLGAARALEEAGEHQRAAELYEQLWDFAAAARASRAGGDLARALRNTFQTRDPAAMETLVGEICAGSVDEMRACAAACEEQGALVHAGRLYDGAGDLDAAARSYEAAGLLEEAARARERSGDLRGALELYRRQLDALDEAADANGRTDGERAALALRVGRLLVRFGRPEEAVPLLQRAWKASHEPAAACAAVAALARLGYSHGASEALEMGRHAQPDALGEASVRDCIEHPELCPFTDEGQDERILAGRYRLGDLLGSGGMGRVYRATDRLTDREVAVKVFTAPGGARGRDAYRRFVREAQTTGQLQHPHIVNLIDFNEEMGFMVLEYMAGGTLAERLRPALSVGQARSVMLQILSGLLAAHQRGIVHRDIKPSNIFFTAAGAAKLGDFGVAHLQDAGQTQTGAFIGTLAFMSPEQITGEPVTFATDIYTLGVMLFQMLSGSLPFSHPDLVNKHLSAPPPAPSSVVAGLPRECDEVVARCLAKRPEDRYDSLAALRRAIEAFPLEDDAAAAAAEGAPAPQPQKRRAVDLRFTVESCAIETPALQILDARDNELGRPVVLLRLAPGPARQRALRLLTAAAAQGDEHLQRVLSLDADRGQAVLEALSGDPLPDPADKVHALRLAEQIGAALAPLHAEGLVHGASGRESLVAVGHLVRLSLAPALAVERPESTAADEVTAVAALLRLEAPPLEDGAALVQWARDARTTAEAQQRDQERRALVEELLRSAPSGLRQR